jgi:hypothetical protein
VYSSALDAEAIVGLLRVYSVTADKYTYVVEGPVGPMGWFAALEVMEPAKILVAIQQIYVGLVAEVGGLVEMVAGEAGT